MATLNRGIQIILVKVNQNIQQVVINSINQSIFWVQHSYILVVGTKIRSQVRKCLSNSFLGSKFFLIWGWLKQNSGGD